MTKELNVVSVGDCVIDNLFYVDKTPEINETVSANGFVCALGGKGANSSVASSRLGSKSAFISKIGDDFFGKYYMSNLTSENINIEHVTVTKDAPTSTASILVDNAGKNAIVVNFGATFQLSTRDLDNAEELIKKCQILITSLVLKPDIALYALKLAKKNNLLTIFNCAPTFKDLDPDFATNTDILVVNEAEAEALVKFSVGSVEDATRACQVLLAGPGYSVGVVITLGQNGCVFGNRLAPNRIDHFPAKKVNAVDSIGAGDAFIGSLAHYLSKFGVGDNGLLNKSVELATEYASISVERKGAQSSYLHLNELSEKFQ